MEPYWEFLRWISACDELNNYRKNSQYFGNLIKRRYDDVRHIACRLVRAKEYMVDQNLMSVKGKQILRHIVEKISILINWIRTFDYLKN